MNISSVGSTYGSLQTYAAQNKSEATEVQQAGRDNDGDSDDMGMKATQLMPTVNMNGQKIGSIINVSV